MEVEINGKVGGNLPAPCTYHLPCYYYYYYYYYLSCVTIVIRDCNYPGTGQLLPQHRKRNINQTRSFTAQCGAQLVGADRHNVPRQA